MWILITVLGLSYLFVIIKLLLKLSGCTIQNIQIPVINWLNSKFNISTRYTLVTCNKQLNKYSNDNSLNEYKDVDDNSSDEDIDDNSSDEDIDDNSSDEYIDDTNSCDASDEDADDTNSDEDTDDTNSNEDANDTNSNEDATNKDTNDNSLGELNSDISSKVPKINKVSKDYDTEDEDSDFQFLNELVQNKNKILVDETLD
jgi:hypothetical protein